MILISSQVAWPITHYFQLRELTKKKVICKCLIIENSITSNT
jgi:hypothetical protein